MRSKGDALRSLRKYVAQTLAPHPRLAALTFGGLTWTTGRQVKDAVDLPRPNWEWLRARSRHPVTTVGSPAAPQSYYLASALVADPTAAAAAAGIALTGDVVPGFGLWNQQEQWEVRLWFDRGEIPEDRPHARVHFVGAGATAGPSLYYELTQPFSIECYPVPPDTVKAAILRAAEVEDLLLEGFRGAGFQNGRPRRIPMWDFDGVDDDETTSLRGGSDYMRLLDFSSRQLPDPQDPRRVAVVCDVRLAWRRDLELTLLPSRAGPPVRGSRIVESVRLDIEGE